MHITNLIFPDWENKNAKIQITARKNKKTVDAEFCSSVTEIQQTVKAFTTSKYDVYYTVLLYGNTHKNTKYRFRRSEEYHAHLLYRRYAILDFDLKDQLPEFNSPKSILKTAIDLTGKPAFAVASGNGVHIYYRLSVTKPEKVLAVQHRLMAFYGDLVPDKPVIDRRAGAALNDIFRIPDSVNQRNGKTVKLVEFDNSDANVLRTGALPAATTRTAKWMGLMPGPSTHYSKEFPDIDFGDTPHFNDVLHVCAVARQFVKDSANGFQRDGKIVSTQQDVINWGAIANLTKGDSDTHREDTIAMLYTWPDSDPKWVDNQVESVRYARGCMRWSDDYKPYCKGCSYLQNYDGTGIPTPIGGATKYMFEQNLTAAVEQVQEKIYKLDNFLCSMGKYIPTGNELSKMRGENKVPTKVSPALFVLERGRIQTSKGTIVNAQFIEDNKNTRRTSIIVRGTDNAQLESLAKAGIVYSNKSGKSHDPKADLLDYFRFQYGQTVEVMPHTGWGLNCTQFAVPEHTYKVQSSGTVQVSAPPILNVDAGKYSINKTADINLWWQAAEELFFCMGEMRAYAKAVIASFTSILYAFLSVESGVKGHSFILVGPPGCGKTVALAGAASVWGWQGFTNTKSDTYAFLINSLATHPNLPVTFDDIMRTGMTVKDDDISQLMHTISEGRNRGRSLSDGSGNMETSVFSNVLLATSNASIRAAIANQQLTMHTASAGMDRITEARVKKLNVQIRNKYRIDIVELSNRCEPVLQDNGGSAGREFLKYVLPRRAELTLLARDNYADQSKLEGANRHSAKFHALLDTTVTVLKRMGRLQRFDSRWVKNPLLNDLPDEPRGSNRQAVRDDLNPFLEQMIKPKDFTAFFRTNVIEILVTVDGQQYKSDIVMTPTQINSSLHTGLHMWIADIRQCKRLRYRFKCSKLFVVAKQMSLLDLAFSRLRSPMKAVDIIETWASTGAVLARPKSKFRVPLPTGDGQTYTGSVIIWPM